MVEHLSAFWNQKSRLSTGRLRSGVLFELFNSIYSNHMNYWFIPLR